MTDELGSLRGELNQQIGSLREDLQEEGVAIRTEINDRIDALQRTMAQFGGAIVVSFVGLVVALLLRGG